MKPYYQDANTTILHGDCIEVMRSMPDNSIDSIVTDPPYGLGFMGKKWDSLPPGEEWARECLRVLKPGGHILAFGGTRTWHRLAVAIEDAGFEMRDSLAWLYGSGFPKSHDVSKGIDKMRHKTTDKIKVTSYFADMAERHGVSRGDVDRHMGTSDMGGWWLSRLPHRCAIPTLDQIPGILEVLGVDPEEVPENIQKLIFELNGAKGSPGKNWDLREITQEGKGSHTPGETIAFDQRASTDRERRDIPATSEAQQWEGWGTALKPAFEPIVLARKPLAEKTVARNVLAHGTGAINIDGCRIATDELKPYSPGFHRDSPSTYNDDSWVGREEVKPAPSGRWPANVILDEHTAELLDQQSGTLKSPATYTRTASVGNAVYGKGMGNKQVGEQANGYGDSGGASRFFYCAKAGKSERPVVDGVAHPTVKPLALMRWLCKLVTPAGGTILDPFAGSGTTIEAALIEGYNVIGIERETDYLPLIQHRINRATS